MSIGRRLRRIILPLTSMGWLVTALLLVSLVGKENHWYFIGFFGSLIALFFSARDQFAFFFFILLTLLTVFLFLIYAFIDGWTTLDQVKGIGIHFTFLVHILALYTLSKYVYSFRSENRMLRRRITQLEEFVFEEGVLTRNEFKKQADMILSNMDRRGETGFLILIDLSRINKRVRNKMLLILSKEVYQIIRHNYDIVGKLDDKTIAVLLQNTDELGLEVIRSRFFNHVEMKVEKDILVKLSFTRNKVKGHKGINELLVIP